MAAKRKIYPAECKREAVSLITHHGYGVSEAARHLGMHAPMLRQWKRTVEHPGAPAFPGHGRLRPAQEALQRRRQENTRLRREGEIVKKAALFFANETRCRRRFSPSTPQEGRCQCGVRGCRGVAVGLRRTSDARSAQ
jgi:transposase